ncbi:MAG: hypothetical protein AAF639_32635 [Chloroflexota bacterium]
MSTSKQSSVVSQNGKYSIVQLRKREQSVGTNNKYVLASLRQPHIISKSGVKAAPVQSITKEK